MNGLKFVKCLLEQNSSPKLQKKVLILIYDLILNDENIFKDNPNFVRKSFG